MEFLKLIGLIGLVTLVGILMQFTWLGFPVWTAWRNRRTRFNRSQDYTAVMQVLTRRATAPLDAPDPGKDTLATKESSTRLAA